MPPAPGLVIGSLGLDPAQSRVIDTLSRRHGHAIWRIEIDTRSFILKWMPPEAAQAEIGSYTLLAEIGVPTPPVYAHTAQALLLEDLAHSDKWRLATEDDVTRPAVGQAVAQWYRIFHDAGKGWLARHQPPAYLKRESDALTPESILATGQRLGLGDHPIWRQAAEAICLLQAAAAQLDTTLNYNDFYWTNLALSRSADGARAIVLDYHLLGIGMRSSDCRNVTGSLGGDAAGAFWAAYGPLDSREALLDRPLATLYALQVASRRRAFPAWAKPARKAVAGRQFEQELTNAVELAHSIRKRQQAKALKEQTSPLYLAYRDPRAPWHAKILPFVSSRHGCILDTNARVIVSLKEPLVMSPTLSLDSAPRQFGWALLIVGLALIIAGIILAETLGTWKWAFFAGAEVFLALSFFTLATQPVNGPS